MKNSDSSANLDSIPDKNNKNTFFRWLNPTKLPVLFSAKKHAHRYNPKSSSSLPCASSPSSSALRQQQQHQQQQQGKVTQPEPSITSVCASVRGRHDLNRFQNPQRPDWSMKRQKTPNKRETGRSNNNRTAAQNINDFIIITRLAKLYSSLREVRRKIRTYVRFRHKYQPAKNRRGAEGGGGCGNCNLDVVVVVAKFSEVFSDLISEVPAVLSSLWTRNSHHYGRETWFLCLGKVTAPR